LLLALDHAQITVPKDSENAAREFYCAFLGLKEIEKPENRKKNGGFWMQAGETQVHVGLEDGEARKMTKAHVAYRVKDLSAWRTRLETRGLKVSDQPPFPNARAFEFRDPFGNRVEFIEYI
jgi:catechol 2,3-dioxygenase-like lactoylglutathione lyase family enzyme